MKLFPMISYRKIRSKTQNGIVYLEKNRWVVEQVISWLQRNSAELLYDGRENGNLERVSFFLDAKNIKITG